MSVPVPLPPASNLERAERQRAIRHLRVAVEVIERRFGDRSFRLWALATLNVLDLLTTAVVLRLGGTESNPAMAPLVEHWWKPIVMKAIVLGLMWLAVLRTPLHSKVAEVGLALAWIFYAGVVGWNTLQLLAF